jgi:peptidyl-prolyl cis-trans isomerase C
MVHTKARWGATLAAALALTFLSLAGCSRHPQAQSQVVAKVNDREITISQLNQALSDINPDTLTPEITQRAIQSLVDEELLVQAAVQNKLDRDPATVAAMEHARRQILAQTYAERMLYPKSPVSLADEEAYFKQHPGLFENRKLYRLTVYTVRSSQLSDLLKADLDSTHSADQVREVLEKHQIKYETQRLNSPAEDLPLEKVADFSAASVGDLLIASQRDGTVLLISVVGLEEKPLSFEAAKPAIVQYLTKKRNTEALAEHLKAERADTKISYVGQFTQYAASNQK